MRTTLKLLTSSIGCNILYQHRSQIRLSLSMARVRPRLPRYKLKSTSMRLSCRYETDKEWPAANIKGLQVRCSLSIPFLPAFLANRMYERCALCSIHPQDNSSVDQGKRTPLQKTYQAQSLVMISNVWTQSDTQRSLKWRMKRRESNMSLSRKG